MKRRSTNLNAHSFTGMHPMIDSKMAALSEPPFSPQQAPTIWPLGKPCNPPEAREALCSTPQEGVLRTGDTPPLHVYGSVYELISPSFCAGRCL